MERVALPLSNESLDETVKVLKALADPTRLRLIQLLLETTPGKALCVNALAARLKVSQPAVSQHLRILRGLDLVVPERRGYRVHYALNRRRLSDCWELVKKVLDLGDTVE